MLATCQVCSCDMKHIQGDMSQGITSLEHPTPFLEHLQLPGRLCVLIFFCLCLKPGSLQNGSLSQISSDILYQTVWIADFSVSDTCLDSSSELNNPSNSTWAL